MTGGREWSVGLFAEGSSPTDPLRDDFGRMWNLLATHFRRDIQLRVFGISKKGILLLSPADLPQRPSATGLVGLGSTGVIGGGEPLDLAIQREHAKRPFDRVVVAFDRWPANELLPQADRKVGCPMRPEVEFVLRRLASSRHLEPRFRDAAAALLPRYQSRDKLQPRLGPLGDLEILFMDPAFEALFVSDPASVRAALGLKKLPHDWPATPKAQDLALAKSYMDRAFRAARRGENVYSRAKSRWGCAIVRAATPTARLWAHGIALRLSRAVAPATAAA